MADLKLKPRVRYLPDGWCYGMVGKVACTHGDRLRLVFPDGVSLGCELADLEVIKKRSKRQATERQAVLAVE